MTLRTTLKRVAVVAVLAGCLSVAATNAHADTLFWDGTQTTWDLVSAWSTDANNADVDPGAIPGASDVASFNISPLNALYSV